MKKSFRKSKLLPLLSGTAALILVPGVSMALTITGMDNSENLAQSLVGSGISIQNVSYTGATAASGYFSGGVTAGIGIESGVVLTTGYASNLHGTTNTGDNITGANNVAGSPILDQLIPGYTTYDATILSFEFYAAGGNAYFNYVFGSDEYNEWVNSSYNDVFGFFLDGTDVGDNVALIPGTTTPVAINNVNNSTNSEYYNDNDPSDTSAPYPFEYDGFTDVFRVEMTGLTDGYHTLTLAIADAGDYVLDSGVFIQGGSLQDVITDPGDLNTPVPEPATMLLFGTGIAGLAGSRIRRRKKK